MHAQLERFDKSKSYSHAPIWICEGSSLRSYGSCCKHFLPHLAYSVFGYQISRNVHRYIGGAISGWLDK